MDTLISLVIMLIVVGIVISVLIWAVRSIPDNFLNPSIKQMIVVLLVLIGLLWILGSGFGYFPSLYHGHDYIGRR